MKIPILSIENKELSTIDLPDQFSEAIEPDLIRRAVLTIQKNKRQKYGSDPRAGKKYSAKLSRRRRHYKGSYGIGISRVPRKIISHRGRRFNWVGAFAPGTVGGRRAHPPKAEKNWDVKINKIENRKAIRSALAAVVEKKLVAERGHKVPAIYPFAVENKIEGMDKTKGVFKILEGLGLKAELKRSAEKKVRSGQGKLRGRKYKTKKGPLIVVSDSCKLLKAAQNIAGVDIVAVKNVNAELLAPGTMHGRLAIFTQAALEKMQKEKLFR